MVDGLIHGQGQKNKEKRGGKIEREKKRRTFVVGRKRAKKSEETSKNWK